LGFCKKYTEFELASEGSIPVIDQSQKDILGFHEGEGEHKASFESPMIIFGDHSCKMQMMFKNFSLAENVIPFKSKGNISLLYLFSLIKDQVETTEYKRHWGELTSKKVLLAPIILQENYANLTIDKMKLIERLKTANNYLVSCRDQLLPRLISGKLSVEDLDIQFPLSMQDQ
jgi:type I restriction enzyme S subunit